MELSPIAQKIQDFVSKNSSLQGKSQDEIISIMLESKLLSAEDVKNLSADKGLNVEKSKKNKQIINLPSGRRVELSDGKAKFFNADGKVLEKADFEKAEGVIDVRDSGRYTVTLNGRTRYYASNGTELNKKYFNQVENKDLKFKSPDGKTYNVNKTVEKRLENVLNSTASAEKSNGVIGSAWSGFKNLTGIGDSSDKVRDYIENEQKLLKQFNSNPKNRAQIFKELTGEEYNNENLEKFIKNEIKLKSEKALNGYIEGQDMAVDVTADIVSGVSSFGIYTAAVAAAPFTGGTSIAVGLAAAATSGAVIKSGLKYAEAKSGGNEYNTVAKDLATGAFSGALAPVTAGLGGAVGKSVATKMGLKVINNGVNHYVGGSIASKIVANSVEAMTDGAVSGAVDNAFRAAYDGGSAKSVANAAVDGFIGGAVLSPIVGGGMKVMGKIGHSIGSAKHHAADKATEGIVDKVLDNAAKSVDNANIEKPLVGLEIYSKGIQNPDGSVNEYAARLANLIPDNPEKLARTLDACKNNGKYDDNLLQMACDMASGKVDNDISVAYDGWRESSFLREDMRVDMLSKSAGLNDNNLQIKQIDKNLSNGMQLSESSKYKQLGMPVINKKTNAQVYLFENLRDAADFNGLRGKNPLSGKNEKGLRFKLQKLKDNGIQTIIDFRAAGECNKVAQKVLADLDLNYVNFPIEDAKWTLASVKNITKYLEAVNKGNFYAGCANGQARTDLGMAINYICNPAAKNIPKFYYDTSSSTRVSVTENIKQIMEILEKNPEIVKEWGWNDYNSFAYTCLDRLDTIKKSLSSSK